MERHLEILGLAVAHADLDLIPVASRWTYKDTHNHARGPSEGGHFLAAVRTTARGLALDLCHARAWLAGHQAAA